MIQKPDSRALRADIEKLAEFCDPEKPGYTRRAFTKVYNEAREWLSGKMRDAGLAVRRDAMGNLIGVLPGSEPALGSIMIGSHTDTVMGGGRFDGIAGVLGGIEIARCLAASGVRLRHTLEVVDFTSEEPSVFGLSTIGSRGMAGELDDSAFLRADPSGRTLAQAVCEIGGCRDFRAAIRKKGDISLYLEMHIEQGPVLENKGRTLGVVTGIVGIHRYRVTVAGVQNHAGTSPMDLRSDALTGAAELLLRLEALCRERKESAVGTAGKLSVEPNAANVIPGRCVFEFEVRSLDVAVMEEITALLQKDAVQIAAERGVQITFDLLSKSLPLAMDKSLLDVLEQACEKTAPVMRLHSGAGHDANHIGVLAPVAMLFVPSKDGKSHCPEEFTPFEDVAAGTDALMKALLLFDERL